MIQNGRHTFPGYLLKKEKLEDDDVITWSTVNGVYPLFPGKAATASSMKRPMNLSIQSSEFLNPGQVSILGADQPLYAIWGSVLTL